MQDNSVTHFHPSHVDSLLQDFETIPFSDMFDITVDDINVFVCPEDQFRRQMGMLEKFQNTMSKRGYTCIKIHTNGKTVWRFKKQGAET